MKHVNFFEPELDFDAGSGKGVGEELHAQLAATLRRSPGPGGAAILPERQLALRLGVDRSLVHRVYSRLVNDGLLHHPPGSRRYYLPEGLPATGTGRLFGVLLPMPYSEYVSNIGSRHVRCGYFSGIFDRAAELGYGIRMVQLPPPDASAATAEGAVRQLAGEVHGLIHLGDRGYDSDPVLEKVLAFPELPQVFLGAEYDGSDVMSAGFDVAQWVKLFTQYLHELGHWSVGLIQPDYWRKHMYCHYDFGDWRDYLDAFRAAGIEVPPEWILLFNDYHMKEKLEDKIARLIHLPRRPTFLLCHSDAVALEVMRILQRLQVRVPEEISVCGFGDEPEARESNPPLTTFRLPYSECGRKAVQMLYDRYHGVRGAESCRLTCQSSLITRSSGARLCPGFALGRH